MNELMLSLLLWIGDHSAYNANLTLPNLVRTEQSNLCQQYGINQKDRCQAQRLAGFFDKNTTIYMRISYDLDDIHHQSQLLHELVHYVQWANQKKDGHYCLGLIEVEAYDLQDQWRKQHGLQPVLSDFNRLMLEASCEA